MKPNNQTIGDFARDVAREHGLNEGEAAAVEEMAMQAIERHIKLGIAAAAALVNATANKAGWYNDPSTGAPIARNVAEVIALMHSELSEALEAWRTDAMDKHLTHRRGIEVEFADCIIRILDTSMALGLDVAGALCEKNRFNLTRADHSHEARRAPGGKKF